MKRKSLITYAAKKLSNLDRWEKYKDKIWDELKNTVNQFNSITDLKFKIEKDHIPMNKTSLESFFNKEFSWYFEENIKSFLKKYKIIYDNDIQQLLKQLINFPLIILLKIFLNFSSLPKIEVAPAIKTTFLIISLQGICSL